MLYRAVLSKFLAVLLTLSSALPGAVFAQTQREAPVVDPNSPIYITSRIFQLTAPQGQYKDLNDQVFRVSTASHSDETKWMATLKKLYPEFTPSVLQTNLVRVFRTSKPALVRFGQMGQHTLDLALNGAQSPGVNESGGQPGTTLIAEISYNEGGARPSKPISHNIQPLEVESGKTYFFASRSLKLSGEKYVGFLRPNAPVERFANADAFLVFAFSVDLDKRPTNVQYFTERSSVALQNDATKKVQPTIPTALKDSGIAGKVTVNVEITPDGKVAKAITHSSNFPEMNEYVVAAARQWEFPLTLFAEKKLPISGLLIFEVP